MDVTLRVVVLDDDAAAERALVDQLKTDGLHVIPRRVDSRMAFEVALDTPPDVVLARYDLPELPALEAVALVRQRGLDVPVIAVGDAIGEDATAECIVEGCVDYVRDKARLPSALSRALQRRQTRRAAEAQRAEETTALQQAEEALERRTRQLLAINRAVQLYLQSDNVEQAYHGLLEEVVKSTDSRAAFLTSPGEEVLVVQSGAPAAPCNATLTDQADSLIAQVRKTQVSLAVEDLVSSPHPLGLTATCCEYGRIVLVPVVVGGDTVAVVGATDAPRPYTDDARHHLESLAHTFALIYESRRRAQGKLLLERELHHAMKMEAVGRLAGGVAHDFNNMLCAVLGFGEIALSFLPPDHEVRDSVQEMLSAAERAATLTRQLLTFSRRQVTNPEALSLNDTIEGMSKILRRVIGEDVALELRLAPGLARIQADRGQMEQVLMNLAVNARDAMPGGGALTFETDEARLDAAGSEADSGTRHIRLRVTDTGTGIAPEVLPHIFEPFFTTKEMGRGTGLGLATIHGIVQQAGGQIRLASELGKGTVFSVYFPLLATDEAASASVADEAPREGTAVVLLVEDDRLVRRIMHAVLTGAGYTVLDAPDAGTALDISRKYDGSIDLLLTDVVMPGMGGRELFERVVSERPGIRLLFVSGYTDDALLRQGVELGTFPLLQKPFRRDALLTRVEQVMLQPPPLPSPAE